MAVHIQLRRLPTVVVRLLIAFFVSFLLQLSNVLCFTHAVTDRKLLMYVFFSKNP